MKSIADIAEWGELDDSGIFVLTCQEVKQLAGINRTMRNIARIALAFLSSDGLSGDDLIEFTISNELHIVWRWKEFAHRPGWDEIHNKRVELHSVLVRSNIYVTNRRINRFCKEISRQLHRKSEFSWEAPYPTVFWR